MSRKTLRSESWTFRRNEQCGLVVVVYPRCLLCLLRGYYSLVSNSNSRAGSLRCWNETTTDQLSVMSRVSLYPCELVYQHNSVKLTPGIR